MLPQAPPGQSKFSGKEGSLPSQTGSELHIASCIVRCFSESLLGAVLGRVWKWKSLKPSVLMPGCSACGAQPTPCRVRSPGTLKCSGPLPADLECSQQRGSYRLPGKSAAVLHHSAPVWSEAVPFGFQSIPPCPVTRGPTKKVSVPISVSSERLQEGVPRAPSCPGWKAPTL